MLDEHTHASTPWFAVAVKPRFDRAVASRLERKGYETFLPLSQKQNRNGANCPDSDLLLFPGYVCCRFEMQNRLRILTTPGVMQILGADNPTALADIEIASLRTALRAQLPVQPFPFIQLGERLRIEGGALAGLEGIVMSFKETLRLVLSITPLQKSVLVEIGRDEVNAAGCANIAQLAAKKGD
jgi:transcription antitermination factor NusG